MHFDELLSRLGFRPKKRGLEAQIDHLRREVSKLSHSASNRAGYLANSVSHRAADISDDWTDSLTDISREAARYGGQIADAAGYHTRRTIRAVKNDPLPVIAVLGTAILLTSLLRRR